jgi:hypothetical protein
MRVRTAAAVALFVPGLIVYPPAAYAACTQWDLARAHRFFWFDQSDGFYVMVDFLQHKNELHGTAEFYAKGHGDKRTRGNVDGDVLGNELNFTLRWSNGSAGVYTGHVSDDGSLSGDTHDAVHRESRATWTSYDGRATCVAEATPPPLPKPDAIEAQRPAPAKPSSGVLVPIPSTGPSPFGDSKPGSGANSTANAPRDAGRRDRGAPIESCFGFHSVPAGNVERGRWEVPSDRPLELKFTSATAAGQP